ncbi:hypothetical protein PPYR_03660 [Photinus pyralis]|uniref:Peptidase S1 domain-containing protein n=1 Tax=Photinus pyralis TaxID=7054 RepID=A0A5N4A3F6_PHOPY|nr:chymotrypsin-1-like [Photinus pyralis]KAB0791860.1 hypothetical protein PPYR_03660 [Photinus pyralis]
MVARFFLCALIYAILAPTLGAKLSMGRILGGSVTADGTHPYAVALRLYHTFYCTGTIINKDCVLTTANCVASVSYKNVEILAGTNNYNSGGVSYRAEDGIPHDLYDPNTRSANVGLLKIKGDIKFDTKTKPIALAVKDPGADLAVTFVVWVKSDNLADVPASNRLRSVSLQTMSTYNCIATLAGDHKIEDKFCTTNKGLCGEGGPLIFNKTLAGISSPIGGCISGKPEIFQSLSNFIDWINGHAC